jgi:CRISPR/Cas system-associated exonuclease Cas4 (RecB family)
MPLLILFLLLAGLLLLWLSRRQLAVVGLPRGRVISLDTLELTPPERALYDAELDLVGRPDYVVKRRSELIPVEVKSSPAPGQPHASHVLQLAAYCRLVSATLGSRPRQGVLKYLDRAVAVDYTHRLEAALLDQLAEMRRLGNRDPDRSHDSPERCRACGHREGCDQRLM